MHFLPAKQCSAQIAYYANNATISSQVGYFQYGAVVGFGSQNDFVHGNGTSPLVTLAAGGSVSGHLFVYNSSGFDQNDGSVDYFVTLNSSTGNIGGGTVNAEVNATNNSRVNITGGIISAAAGDGNVNAYDSSIVTLNGGNVQASLGGADNSTVNVNSGTVGAFLSIKGNASLHVTGGAIGRAVRASDSSNVTIGGGDFNTSNNGSIDFYDNTSGSFTFVGTGLSYIDLGPDPGGGEDYALTGLLQNEPTNVNNLTAAPASLLSATITGAIVNVAQGATMFSFATPTPEPSAFVTLTIGVLSLLGRRLRSE